MATLRRRYDCHSESLATLRHEFTAKGYEEGVWSTSFEVNMRNPIFEKREVQVARFAAADYATKVTVSDADLEAFYKNNQALFQM